MSEIIKKAEKLGLNKKIILLVALGIIVLLSGILSGVSEEKAEISDNEYNSSRYIEETQKELEALLSQISGAGKVRVMISLENAYENVYATGQSTKAERDETAKKQENTEEYIIVKTGSNTEECLIVKVYEPKIKGVAVIAQGAGNTTVEKAITDTVCALFDISTQKVSVEKMN